MRYRIITGLLKPLAIGAALFFAGPGFAQTASLENAVKATYLYKFAPFVQWPDSAFASPSAALNICVLGNGTMGDLIAQAIAGQRDGARDITVRNLSAPDSGCQILYIPGSDAAAIGAALSVARGKPILTVTDVAANSGQGIVVFVNDGGHVRFDIDAAAATQSGLIISSKLLSLSRSAKSRSGS